ncbi:MAG: esterase family protein [Flavobacteriia bacterium]|nr:MAG: esterase family protein [Flavobacteriia bacterium]
MRKAIKHIFQILLAFSSLNTYSSKVDTVSTYSPSMGKSIKAVVITPDSYASDKKYPVVYLLHGYSGNYADWIRRSPSINQYADQYDVIIVCPDANYSSWYLDSPMKPESKYETYIAKELVSWVDQNYSTLADRSGRAITGLSMGGHGALSLAIKHQDVYSIAGSMSGGVDIRPFPGNWEISQLLGSIEDFPDRWKSHSVVELAQSHAMDSLEIIMTCGSEDFFFGVNNDLHQILLEKKVPHTYISAPGGHTWDFWVYSIGLEMDFIHEKFQERH